VTVRAVPMYGIEIVSPAFALPVTLCCPPRNGRPRSTPPDRPGCDVSRR